MIDHILKKSYSPYSGIDELCLVQGKSGLVYPGVRIENSSFPLTISSIQSAVSSCLANQDQPESYWHGDQEPELINYWVDEYQIKKNHELESTSESALYNPYINEVSDLEDRLSELCEQAVTPNSNFSVSALLETERGYVPGVNVEGSSWALGLCAERVAISRAIAAGSGDFLSMYIMAPKSNFCSPCGACRQVIHEFMPKKQIHLYHNENQKTIHVAEHLLPYAFTANSL
jgi:homotetrameric cytidine deaminase